MNKIESRKKKKKKPGPITMRFVWYPMGVENAADPKKYYYLKATVSN